MSSHAVDWRTGGPDRIVEGGIPEDRKSASRVHHSHRAQTGIDSVLIEEPTMVRPPHRFIVNR
jgi:hypothetical protein